MYLVTGGSGFIGVALARLLRAEGEAVRVLDVRLPMQPVEGVDYRQGSVLDAAALDSALEGVRGVFHLAAIAHLWQRDVQQFSQVNAEGTRRVLEALSRRPDCRLVHVSTEALYLNAWAGDRRQLPPLEAMPGPYTRSKWHAHRAVQAAADNGLRACLVSPAVPIGADDWQRTAPTRMLQDLIAEKHPAYLDCLLNLVSVEDVAVALLAAMHRGECGEHYLLSACAIWMRDLLALLQACCAIRVPKRQIPYSVAIGSAYMMEGMARFTGKPPSASVEAVRLARYPRAISGEEAAQSLNFSYRDIRQTLVDAVAWLRENPPE